MAHLRKFWGPELLSGFAQNNTSNDVGVSDFLQGFGSFETGAAAGVEFFGTGVPAAQNFNFTTVEAFPDMVDRAEDDRGNGTRSASSFAGAAAATDAPATKQVGTFFSSTELSANTAGMTLAGGKGDDRYYVYDHNTVVVEKANQGTDTIFASKSDGYSLAFAPNVENLTLLGSSSSAAIGNDLNNVLIGNAGRNILNGGLGKDTLTGGGGSDIFILSKGNGSDTVTDFMAGVGGDVLRVQNYGFGSFSTFMAAAKQVGSDVVVNLSSTETVTLKDVTLATLIAENIVLDAPLAVSGAATNTLAAAQAGTTQIGSSANDSFQAAGLGVTLKGGAGDDRYVVYDHNTKVIEQAGEGVDTIFAARYDGYSLVNAPNVENLTLTGSTSGPATGNDLNNILTGNAGNNTLDGGLGNDVLIGGAGIDTFVIKTGNGSDTIRDFSAGVGGDILQLTGTTFKTFADVQAAMTQAGTDVILNLGNGEIVTFQQTTIQKFVAANVHIVTPLSDLVQTFNEDFNSLSLGQDPSLTWKTSYAWSGAAGYLLSGEQGIYVDGSFRGLPGSLAPTSLGLNPFSLQDGQLVITAQPISAEDAPYVGGASFSTGLITTENSFVQTYGYFEMTATLPDTTGAWPAFWLIPISGRYSSELDVLENFGQNPDHMHWQVHSATGSAAGAGSWANTADLTSGSHTFAVKWTPYELIFLVDGSVVGKASTPSDMNTAMYMLANLAMGGWAGDADAGSTATFTIDSIKAYQLSEYTLANYSLRTSEASTNTIGGTSAADTLAGTTGNDLIGGAGGADIMAGGVGDDTYIVTDANAKVTEVIGGGVDTVQSSVTYVLSDYVENLTLSGSAAINGTGNSQSNIIVGNAADNVITGGLGNDVLTGGGGSDTFVINKGDGSDIITDFQAGSGAGHDIVKLNSFEFTSFGDVMSAMTQVGDDVYLRLTYYETLVFRDTDLADFSSDNFELPAALPTSGAPTSWWNGTGAGQFVYGTSMNDNLTTGGIGNTLVGWSGDDTYVVGSGNTTVVERVGDGVDSVQAWVSYTLAPNVENLTLMKAGLSGTGNELANRMVGSNGADVLNGGGGDDWLSGGSGNDTFIFGVGSGHDTIADFHVYTSPTAEADKLVFKGYGEGAYLTSSGDEWTVHYAGGTDTLHIVGVTTLSASDYMFVV